MLYPFADSTRMRGGFCYYPILIAGASKVKRKNQIFTKIPCSMNSTTASWMSAERSSPLRSAMRSRRSMIDESNRTERTRFDAGGPFFIGAFLFLPGTETVFFIPEWYRKTGKNIKISTFIRRTKYVQYTIVTN